MAKRILVVDDEPSMIRLVEVHLSRAGYEVATALDGHSALAEARRQH
ncbi:MAG: response regulator, partial [Armatimonadetes bacterium]|nr:response regulator [Armatimonadota bacterium]